MKVRWNWQFLYPSVAKDKKKQNREKNYIKTLKNVHPMSSSKIYSNFLHLWCCVANNPCSSFAYKAELQIKDSKVYTEKTGEQSGNKRISNQLNKRKVVPCY